MSDEKHPMTIADNFLATAQALGLTPRERREAMDQLQAAADRTVGASDE